MNERNGDEYALPELRFVAVDSLVPHEQHDPTRLEPLMRRILEQGKLRNPPVVAPLPGAGGAPRYVVLDGANRAHAARAAGLPHVVAQIVPYTDPPVRLTTCLRVQARCLRCTAKSRLSRQVYSGKTRHS